MEYIKPPLDPDGNPSGSDQAYFDHDGSKDGAIIQGAAVEHPMREIVHLIDYSGQTPDKDDLQQLRKAIQLVAGEHILDVSFMAGVKGDGTGEDLKQQRYGFVVFARPGKIYSHKSSLGLAGTGAAVQIDYHLNSVSIFTTKPKAAIGATAFDDGAIGFDANENYKSVAAGDLLEFFVTDVGSTIAGQELASTLKVGA